MVIKSHSLKIIKDQDYGFIENGVVGINVERLWLEFQDEEAFIHEFASTYAHEMLHIALAPFGLPEVVEEEVIRAMLGEAWDEEIEQMY